jgi:hypothetical protein
MLEQLGTDLKDRLGSSRARPSELIPLLPGLLVLDCIGRAMLSARTSSINARYGDPARNVYGSRKFANFGGALAMCHLEEEQEREPQRDRAGSLLTSVRAHAPSGDFEGHERPMICHDYVLLHLRV